MEVLGRGSDRRHRRRAFAATLAATLALAVAGCSSSSAGQSSAGPLPVTAEQALTTCFHNYFYNGVLPESAAKANCTACVVQSLRKLGIKPSPGETEMDVLTGVRLSTSAAQSLQSACTESDLNSQ